MKYKTLVYIQILLTAVEAACSECALREFFSYYSAFAFNERVETLKSVAETVMFLCFIHDFHMHHFLRFTETVCKTIFYTFEEVI